MVRQRLHSIVPLGHMNEALQWFRDMNEVAKRKGWPEGRVLMPASGPINKVVYEIEYADLAAMEATQNAFFSDAEAMKVFRKGIEFNAPGSHPWDELEISAPDRLA
jgi:hypothetical protein